ncbi:MAG: dihydropteroate synthase [Dehalococcoidia bacterium]
MTKSANEFQWNSKTFIMGVINITPDSFSGDGIASDLTAVAKQALSFKKYGADIIDVGGESSRPSSIYGNVQKVSIQDEMDRVIPAIDIIKKNVNLPISIDSRNSTIVEEAICHGASMINDISMLNHDKKMIALVAKSNLPYILMHNQKIAKDKNVIKQIKIDLQMKIDILINKGFNLKNLIIDPGIGFNKNTTQNIQIIGNLDKLKFGFPILIGTSRKKHIGDILSTDVHDRIEGTAATSAIAIANGADIIRVHDVKEMARVAKMSDAIIRQLH